MMWMVVEGSRALRKIAMVFALAASAGCAVGGARVEPRSLGAAWGSGIVAHRGASADAPENTLAAYRRALELGADAAECDVRVSRDGEVVLLHDNRLDRTTDGTGRVGTKSLRELSRLDAGTWHGLDYAAESVPTLAQVFDTVDGQMTLFVELKAGDRLVERVAAVLSDRDPRVRQQVVLLSFRPRLLRRAHELMPDVPTLLLRDGGGSLDPALVRRARAAGVQAVGLSDPGARRNGIRRLREAGLGVFVYTVDDPERARELLDWGVDGIITNDPGAVDRGR